MKKLLALMLLACLVLSLCACPGGPTTGGETCPDCGKNPCVCTTTYIDHIDKEYNFGGDSLSISIRNDYVYEIYADSTSQEGLDPEIYKRNSAIEKRFNLKVKPLQSLCQGVMDNTTHFDDVTLALQKGNFKFDVIFMKGYLSGQLILGMNYFDWRMQNEDGSYVLPYTGESLANKEAWWPAGINDALNVMGSQYIAVSDMSISAMESAYSIVYNYDMVTADRIPEGLGYRDMYDIVKQGDWTLDLFYNLVKDSYKDNANSGIFGQKDDADTYGFMYDKNTGIDSFVHSLGFQCVVNDGVNMPKLWTMNQTLITAAEDVAKLCLSSGAIGKLHYEEDWQFFAERHAYFATMLLSGLRTATMHGMEDDYGVLPYPKLNKDQKDYLTGSDDHCSVLSIPLMIHPDRYEIIGVGIEALSARTNQVVKKEFYDTMLKTNSTRNLQDEEMIDMILNNRVYDLGIFHRKDLLVSTASDGSLSAFFRYLVTQEPGLSPSDYWARGKDVLQGGENTAGSLASLIKQYVDMLG